MPIKADQLDNSGGAFSRNSSTLTSAAATTSSKKGYSKKRAGGAAASQLRSDEATLVGNQPPIVIASDNEGDLDEVGKAAAAVIAAQPLQNPTVPSKHNAEKIDGGEQQITVSTRVRCPSPLP
jgi:hypothetical protein